MTSNFEAKMNRVEWDNLYHSKEHSTRINDDKGEIQFIEWADNKTLEESENLRKLGHYEEAIARIKEDPSGEEDPRTLSTLCLAAIGKNDHDEAYRASIRAMEKALFYAASRIGNHLALLIDQERFSEVIELADSGKTVYPREPSIRINKLIALDYLQEDEKIREELKSIKEDFGEWKNNPVLYQHFLDDPHLSPRFRGTFLKIIP